MHILLGGGLDIGAERGQQVGVGGQVAEGFEAGKAAPFGEAPVDEVLGTAVRVGAVERQQV